MTEAAQNVYDAFEFLAMLDEKGEFKTGFHDVNHKYLYHVPCHLRAQGIGLPVLDIMRQIPGLAIETADAGCCGMSGNYGFKGDKYEISMKIGEKLFNRIQQSNADEVLTDCGTCRLQIRHGAKAETCHPIEILAEAYGK
jgi:glycerol-3-phosphate dehydrogenase subunit C